MRADTRRWIPSTCSASPRAATLARKARSSSRWISGGRFGKAEGRYTNVATSFEAKFTLTDSIRISFAAVPAYYGISGVKGMEDRRQGVLESVDLEMRYRLLDRTRSPFGVTISITPSRGVVEGGSGVRASRISNEFLLIADRELVPGRVFTAFNVGYDLASTRIDTFAETVRHSFLEVSMALAGRVAPGVFVGAELRHLSRYDGLSFDNYAGRALYLGPTLYATLPDHWWLSAAWNVQARGAAAGEGGALNLTDFERHQVKLRLGKNF